MQGDISLLFSSFAPLSDLWYNIFDTCFDCPF